jgi:hypothetical protein
MLAGSPKLGAEIIDVFLATAPLTIAVAIIFVLARSDLFSTPLAVVIASALILYVAALIANTIHLGIRPVEVHTHGGSPLQIVAGLLQDYCKAYRGVPFLKSIVLGLFFGRWYFRLSSHL